MRVIEYHKLCHMKEQLTKTVTCCHRRKGSKKIYVYVVSYMYFESLAGVGLPCLLTILVPRPYWLIAHNMAAKIDFQFCAVCRRNHNLGRRHIYSKNHCANTKHILNKYGKKVCEKILK